MIAGVTGIPTVAAIIGGAGLAGRLQAGQAIGVQTLRGTTGHHLLQADADQVGGDGVTFLCRCRGLVVTLEQLALRIKDATHRVQRLDLATRCQELVQLRHRVRALVGRAEDHRRIRLGLDAGQHMDQLGHPLRANLHAHAYRGLVVGVGERVDQAHGAMAAVVRIAGVPVAAAAELHGHRRIVDPAGQRIAVRLREREQVHERLEQRADRALRLDGAVEADLGHFAAADHRHHVTVVHVGHHQAGLQLGASLAFQRLDGARDRAFGIGLRGRRHAAHHAQAGALQGRFRVVVAKLATYQVDVGGEAVGRHQPRGLGHAQRRLQRPLVLGIVDQGRLVQFAQHEVATVQRTLGIAPRVVVGRPLDQADQQRDLLGFQRGKIAPEPELGTGGHAVDRLAAALAQIYLVEVGLEDGALVIARFHDQRVQHFVEFAGDGLFLADAEQATAGQLLGQGGSALAALPTGADRHPDRARDAGQIDAVMAVEILVLDRLQASDQQVRGLVHADQAAFFLLLPIQRGDARRIHAGRLQRLAAVGVAQRGDAAAGQRQLDPTRGDLAIDIVVAAAGNDEAAALHRIGCRLLALAIIAIGRGGQFGLQGRRIHRLAGHQHQRPCIDARRDLPAQFTETLRHLLVQVQRIGDQETQSQRDRRHAPGDQPAAPERTGVLLVVVVEIVDIV
ncbi:hypothetical protein D3C73_781660 [compost metagenome]